MWQTTYSFSGISMYQNCKSASLELPSKTCLIKRAVGVGVRVGLEQPGWSMAFNQHRDT